MASRKPLPQTFLNRRELLARGGSMALLGAAGLSSLRCRATDEAAPATVVESEFSAYDGVGLAELVAKGEATPLELVEDVLRKIDAVNGRLNAVLPALFDSSKATARASGALGAGPLSGVPVMLKNLTSYAEASIDNGSRLWKAGVDRGLTPDLGTSPLVQAMEDTGMVITGITSSPEFGLIDNTEPVLHGSTQNPWNIAYTAGGSSGGSGSAVAAGIVPIAHGNDGGGSIRLPASQCGIYGLKPSRGRELGNEGGNLAISSDLCLSRTVRDTAAFLSVTERTGADALPPVGFVGEPSEERVKVALMTQSFHGAPPHPEVDQAVRATAELMQELGHEVTEVPLPIDGEEFVDTFIGLWASGTLQFEVLAEAWAPGVAIDQLLEPWTLGLIALGKERGADAARERAERVFGAANEAMETLFAEHDVMLSPVVREPPYRLGDHAPTVDFDILYQRVLDKVAYTPLQNATGMPGASLPMHWTADGLPVGVQLSAWRGEEARILQLSYELEEARPWRDKRPPVFAA